MRLKRLLAVPAASLLTLSASAGCSAGPEVTCTYVAEAKHIPDPAFWANTAHAGLQLIEPGSALSQVITERLGSVAVHDEVRTGDVLVATEYSFLIDPESLGVDRQAISNCQLVEPLDQTTLQAL